MEFIDNLKSGLPPEWQTADITAGIDYISELVRGRTDPLSVATLKALCNPGELKIVSDINAALITNFREGKTSTLILDMNSIYRRRKQLIEFAMVNRCILVKIDDSPSYTPGVQAGAGEYPSVVSGDNVYKVIDDIQQEPLEIWESAEMAYAGFWVGLSMTYSEFGEAVSSDAEALSRKVKLIIADAMDFEAFLIWVGKIMAMA